MPGIENFNTNPGGGGGGVGVGGGGVGGGSPALQLQLQTPVTNPRPFADPPVPRTFDARLPAPKFADVPTPRFGGGSLGKLGGGGSAVSNVVTVGVAAVQAGWALGQQIDENNQPKYGGSPMPASYGKPPVLEDVQPGVIGYEVEGVYLVDDGSEYAFGGHTGPRPGVYVVSVPHPQFGGSNGNGALIDYDEKGVIVSGQAFYRTQCYASLCGLKGYRIDKLIPKYADGTAGKNQAAPKPHYTTDPDYTGELAAPPASPASEPQTKTPTAPGVYPGSPLGAGQKNPSPNLSKSPSAKPEPPPRPDFQKAPDPFGFPAPKPKDNYNPAPTGFGGPKTSTLNPPSPNIDLSKSPNSTPAPSPAPTGAPKSIPSPLGSPNLQPDPCEPNPCMSSMNSTISDLWDMLQYLLGLLEQKEADVNVIVCDCVNGSPVYTSKEISVLKGNEASTVLQCYEIATTKGLVCLGSGSSTTLSKTIPPVEIEVPVIQCEDGKPVSYKLKIPVAKGSELRTYSYFNELAEIKRQNCILGSTVGVDDYPATLPASLISKDDGFLGNLIPDETVEIKSLTQFIGWFTQRFDEVIGQWEQNIIIKDTDPATPGDQPQGVKLPNISETLAEIFSMGFQNQINNDLLINITTRILTETGSIKQQGFKSYGLVQTLVDYFNYQYVDKEKKMPLSFTINETSFDKILKESEVSVAVADYEDPDNFKKSLQRLLEGAAIIKALNWRKVNTAEGSNVKEQFVNVIKERAKQLKDEMDKQSTNIDAFLVEAEKGFSTTPGVPDPNMPYGESYDNRPIIKKLKEEK